jgi:hypothetical protein
MRIVFALTLRPVALNAVLSVSVFVSRKMCCPFRGVGIGRIYDVPAL